MKRSTAAISHAFALLLGGLAEIAPELVKLHVDALCRVEEWELTGVGESRGSTRVTGLSTDDILQVMRLQ